MIESLSDSLQQLINAAKQLADDNAELRSANFHMRSERAALIITEQKLRAEIAELHKQILSHNEKNWEHG